MPHGHYANKAIQPLFNQGHTATSVYDVKIQQISSMLKAFKAFNDFTSQVNQTI